MLNRLRPLAGILALGMAFALTGCSKKDEGNTKVPPGARSTGGGTAGGGSNVAAPPAPVAPAPAGPGGAPP